MLRIPVTDVMITEKCNMACKYCFETDKCGKSMNMDNVMKYIKKNGKNDYFLFGGEPLLEPEICEELFKHMKQPKVITNGTLIKKNLELLKKYKVEVQISLDGPELINDSNRVFHSGNGTFDKVMQAIELCEEEKLTWTVHGVVNKSTLPWLYDIWMFYINLMIKYKGIEELYYKVNGNLFQIIFEEDFNDKDIGYIINGFIRVLSDIKRIKEIDYSKFVWQLTTRKGGVCGAGTGLFALDTNMNVYACHRLIGVPEREKYKLCNVNHPEDIDNYKLHKQYGRVRNHGMYSSIGNNLNGNVGYWHMWCPGTNIQTSDNIYYQSCKYNLMIEQLEKVLSEYRDNWGKQPDNSNGHKCDN